MAGMAGIEGNVLGGDCGLGIGGGVPQALTPFVEDALTEKLPPPPEPLAETDPAGSGELGGGGVL